MEGVNGFSDDKKTNTETFLFSNGDVFNCGAGVFDNNINV